MFRNILILLMLFAGHTVPAADKPMYPYPVTATGADIELEDCVPSAMAHLRRGDFLTGKGMKTGEDVLIVTDRSIDPLVTEAYYVAAQRMGAGKIDTIILQGRLEVTDPTTLILEVFEKNTWPQWVWDAAAKVDRVVALSFTSHVHAMASVRVPGQGLVKRWTQETGTEFHSARMFRERLCTEPYPGQIIGALVANIWETLRTGRKYHLTDPNGTDLSWTVEPETWLRYLEVFGSRVNNHAPRLHLSKAPNMQGKLVSRRLHSGTIPEIELTIEGGRVVAITGGGKMGDYMRGAFEKYAHVKYPLFPGPGINWVEYAVWGWIPHLAPAADAKTRSWTARFAAEKFENRAGVVHVAIGTGAGALTTDFANQHGYPIHHKDFNIYRATLTVDGKKVVDGGHLVALDDPEIRRIAAKYGDPDKLLKPIWTPGDDPRY
jgi:leucyl aminopeptidase (aminopeptidase T)